MYQNIKVGDIVLYCPEFYAAGSRHDQLYELIEVIGDRALIRSTKDPQNEKNVLVKDLELSFSMNNPDEEMPW